MHTLSILHRVSAEITAMTMSPKIDEPVRAILEDAKFKIDVCIGYEKTREENENVPRP